MKIPEGPEDRLTAWLGRLAAREGPDLLGDDAAFFPGTRVAATVDQQIAGIHFPEGLAPAVVARRLVAVSLSDVAAVGGEPKYGLLTVATPRGFRLRSFLAAAEAELTAHGAHLAGGDLARAPKLSATLTVLASLPRGGRWVRRGGGRPGDRLWISGSVGESALGRRLVERGARLSAGRVRLPRSELRGRRLTLATRRAVRRHLEPEIQLELGRWLARRRRAAAIDVSDGLLLDLSRLCRSSQTGARIKASRLPLAPDFIDLADTVGADPLELALAGGEDYVLLFALAPTMKPPKRFGAVEIGRLQAQPEIDLIGADRPASAGWDHLDARQRAPLP